MNSSKLIFSTLVLTMNIVTTFAYAHDYVAIKDNTCENGRQNVEIYNSEDIQQLRHYIKNHHSKYTNYQNILFTFDGKNWVDTVNGNVKKFLNEFFREFLLGENNDSLCLFIKSNGEFNFKNCVERINYELTICQKVQITNRLFLSFQRGQEHINQTKMNENDT